MEMFSPGTSPSRIMKAAAASEPIPPPTKYAFTERASDATDMLTPQT
jgi:hypothetical protein